MGEGLLRLDEIGAEICDELSGSSNFRAASSGGGPADLERSGVSLSSGRVSHEVALRHVGSLCRRGAGVTMLSLIKLASAGSIGLRCSVTI